MIPSNSRLPLVGDRWSHSTRQAKTKAKSKPSSEAKGTESLPPSARLPLVGPAAVQTASERRLSARWTLHPASGSSFNEKMLRLASLLVPPKRLRLDAGASGSYVGPIMGDYSRETPLTSAQPGYPGRLFVEAK